MVISMTNCLVSPYPLLVVHQPPREGYLVMDPWAQNNVLVGLLGTLTRITPTAWLVWGKSQETWFHQPLDRIMGLTRRGVV